MKPTSFSWQTSQNQSIFAQEWVTEGTPRAGVVLVHGLGEHINRYQQVAEAFNQAGLDLLGFDLPGHGRSEGPRGHTSFDNILVEIDQAIAEMRQRHPNIPVFLYGHSLGGELVLYYTLKRRPSLQGVISTSPSVAPGTSLNGLKKTMAKVLSRLSPGFTTENGLDVNNLSHDQEIVKAYQQDQFVHPRISAQLGLDLVEKGQWILAHAERFPLPLLLVVGTCDQLVSVEAVQQFAARAPKELVTLKLWQGFYHETHNEPEKEEVLAFSIDWINKQLQA